MLYSKEVSIFAVAVILASFHFFSCDSIVVPLDSKNTKDLDIHVRRHMLISINKKLESELPEYSRLRKSCEQIFNSSVEQCNKCSKEIKEIMDSSLYKLLTILFLPDIVVTEFLKKVAENLQVVVEFLGGDAKEYLEGLTELSDKFCSGLKDSLRDLQKTTLKGLIHLTEQLENSIKDVARFTVKGIQDVSEKVGELAEEAGKTLERLGEGLTDAAGKIVDAGKEALGNAADAVNDVVKGTADAVGDVVKVITNPISSIRISLPRIGGWGKKKKKKRDIRRRNSQSDLVTEEKFRRELDEMLNKAKEAEMYVRSVLVKKQIAGFLLDLGDCPICDKIDTKKRSAEAIMDDLCAETRHLEKELLKTIRSAQRLFDFVRNENVTVVKRVEFDPAAYTIGKQGLSYTKVNVTASVESTSYYFRSPASLNFGNLTALGDAIVEELMRRIFPSTPRVDWERLQKLS